MNRHDIIRFRASHNLSAEELIEVLGVRLSTKAVSHYERGRLEIPKWLRVKLEEAIEMYGVDEKIPHDLEFYKKKGFERIVASKEEVQKPVEQKLPPASSHYNAGKEDAIDPITFGLANFNQDENLGFYRINAIKYIARFGKKEGFNMDDLDKAIYYINKMKEVIKQ